LSFVVVVPAHNEEGGIAETVASVHGTSYPADERRVVVIADNCEDRTADRARKAGADVVERHDTESRGKGQALDWFFRTHRQLYDRTDVVTIVDADTQLCPEYFTEMGASLSVPGVEAVQAYYGVSNPQANWRTSLSAAALAVFHHLRPAGRNVLGGTAGLKGNGMAFRTRIVRENGWPAFSIDEDVEFTLQLLLQDTVVIYNPDAIVYGEMAVSARQADVQRQRWEGGRLQLLREYGPKLLAKTLRRPRWATLDGVIELSVLPFSLLVMMQILTGVWLTAMWLDAWVWPVSWLAIDVLYVTSGLRLRRVPGYVWRALLSAPLFILWKIPVYLRMVVSGPRDRWVRTPREGEESDGGQQ